MGQVTFPAVLGSSNLPRNLQSASYTVSSTDKGKLISTDSNIIFDSGTTGFAIGDIVTIYNRGSASISVSVSGSSISIHRATGLNTTALTLAAKGLVRVLLVNTTGIKLYLAEGTGITG